MLGCAVAEEELACTVGSGLAERLLFFITRGFRAGRGGLGGGVFVFVAAVVSFGDEISCSSSRGTVVSGVTTGLVRFSVEAPSFTAWDYFTVGVMCVHVGVPIAAQ